MAPWLHPCTPDPLAAPLTPLTAPRPRPPAPVTWSYSALGNCRGCLVVSMSHAQMRGSARCSRSARRSRLVSPSYRQGQGGGLRGGLVWPSCRQGGRAVKSPTQCRDPLSHLIVPDCDTPDPHTPHAHPAFLAPPTPPQHACLTHLAPDPPTHMPHPPGTSR